MSVRAEVWSRYGSEGDESLQHEQTVQRDDAFAALVARRQHLMFRVAYALLRNAHDAEDAVQEAFLKLYRGERWRQMEDEKAFLDAELAGGGNVAGGWARRWAWAGYWNGVGPGMGGNAGGGVRQVGGSVRCVRCWCSRKRITRKRRGGRSSQAMCWCTCGWMRMANPTQVRVAHTRAG